MQTLAPRIRRPELIMGGVDTDFFAPGPAGSLGEDAWGDHAGPLLFCARRLVPRTGVLTLIDALPSLLETVPALRVAVSGTGPLEDRIAERIREGGLGGAVRMLGRLSDVELRDWYRRATVVAVPSTHLEGFGLTTAEALACGTPVVGTPVAATPELLQRLDPRLIADDPSAEGLAAAVARALAMDRGELSELGRRGRELVVREWSMRAVAQRHVALYSELAARRAVSCG